MQKKKNGNNNNNNDKKILCRHFFHAHSLRATGTLAMFAIIVVIREWCVQSHSHTACSAHTMPARCETNKCDQPTYYWTVPRTPHTCLSRMTYFSYNCLFCFSNLPRDLCSQVVNMGIERITLIKCALGSFNGI